MRRKIIAYAWIALVFMLSGAYLYLRGIRDGVERYKHSKNFHLALESAYEFGRRDCRR